MCFNCLPNRFLSPVLCSYKPFFLEIWQENHIQILEPNKSLKSAGEHERVKMCSYEIKKIKALDSNSKKKKKGGW